MQKEEWLPDPKGFERHYSGYRTGKASVREGMSVAGDLGGGGMSASKAPRTDAWE